MKTLSKSKIALLLKEYKIQFIEDNSRMNYGFIGKLVDHRGYLVCIFPSSFQIHNKEFTLNEKSLQLIQSIQKRFKELTRDNENRIIVFENSIYLTKDEKEVVKAMKKLLKESIGKEGGMILGNTNIKDISSECRLDMEAVDKVTNILRERNIVYKSYGEMEYIHFENQKELTSEAVDLLLV